MSHDNTNEATGAGEPGAPSISRRYPGVNEVLKLTSTKEVYYHMKERMEGEKKEPEGWMFDYKQYTRSQFDKRALMLTVLEFAPPKAIGKQGRDFTYTDFVKAAAHGFYSCESTVRNLFKEVEKKAAQASAVSVSWQTQNNKNSKKRASHQRRGLLADSSSSSEEEDLVVYARRMGLARQEKEVDKQEAVLKERQNKEVPPHVDEVADLRAELQALQSTQQVAMKDLQQECDALQADKETLQLAQAASQTQITGLQQEVSHLQQQLKRKAKKNLYLMQQLQKARMTEQLTLTVALYSEDLSAKDMGSLIRKLVDVLNSGLADDDLAQNFDLLKNTCPVLGKLGLISNDSAHACTICKAFSYKFLSAIRRFPQANSQNSGAIT